MIILPVMQFTPFWQYGDAGESCSISSYVWFPSDHKALESWIGSQVDGFDLSGFVGMPILTLVLCAFGAVICLMKPEQEWVALLSVICGAAGMVNYLGNAALRLGVGWTWHLFVCIVLLALGTAGLVQWCRNFRAE